MRHLIRERDTFFIGRGLDYAFSLEGALKLKEISYIHAEAYAAGELKHGTIALIYDNVPVIAIATQDHVFAKTISNIREVKARGAYVILLAKKQSVVEDGVADMELRIPDLEDRFTVFPIAVALQLIAYYASIGKHLMWTSRETWPNPLRWSNSFMAHLLPDILLDINKNVTLTKTADAAIPAFRRRCRICCFRYLYCPVPLHFAGTTSVFSTPASLLRNSG